MGKVLATLLDLLIIALLVSTAFFVGYLIALREAVMYPLWTDLCHKFMPPQVTHPVGAPASDKSAELSREEKSERDATIRTTYEYYQNLGKKPELPFIFLPPGRSAKKHNVKGHPVTVERRKVNGFALYVVKIDLTEPDVYPAILLANGAQVANNADTTSGDETFASFVKRARAAVAINGTFFSKDKQKRVMGNMVSAGKSLKYSQWENYGTTLGIDCNNVASMTTARLEGQPKWNEHWFSLTCGPRLLRHGVVASDAAAEGFTDDHVLTVGPRQAIGIGQGNDSLYLASFISAVSLQDAGKVMKSIGCVDAMNLDGGASRGFAVGQEIKITPGRPLTNVIVVYDATHPAPAAIQKSWHSFEKY